MVALAPPPPPPPIYAPCPAAAKELHAGGEVRLRSSFPSTARDPDGKTIRVYFERYPRRNSDLPRKSTIVSLEGGPGYPVTQDRRAGSSCGSPCRAGMTSCSSIWRARGQRGARLQGVLADQPLRPARGPVRERIGPERDRYSTSQGVQDIEAVLRLHAGRVDMYGDSYGTYAAQAYALRFPQRLRSLALEGPTAAGQDPAWADLVEAIRIGLELTCSRSVGCPTGIP